MSAHKTVEDISSFLADLLGSEHNVAKITKEQEERGISYVIHAPNDFGMSRKGIEYCVGYENDELLFYQGKLIGGAAYKGLKPIDGREHPLAVAVVNYINPHSQIPVRK